ncbi:hypothetical protein OPV22_017222 [Ensete ventricosum]|uniref:Uncharacterized protein n=1 Tax=Ensete ventricosum TaxID=4639 RepID=A0AAV8R0G6_ENSVE|nr:hypothetical protein OPV22_017222 [Ensete ventricosum]
MIGADAKALQALEAMKSHHDFDSTICLESLGSVRKHFSIPSENDEHELDARKSPGRGGGGASCNCTLGSVPAPTSPPPSIPPVESGSASDVPEIPIEEARGRVINSLDGKVTLLRQELQDLKEGGNPDAVAATEV